MTNEPLGLPRGSVRAVLTFVLVVGAILTLFVPVVDDRAMGMLLAAALMAVQSYFTQRGEQNQQDGPVLPAPATDGDEG